MKTLPAILLLLLSTSAFAASTLFDQAESARNHRKPADAIEIYNKLIARPTLPADDRFRCRLGVIDCFRQQTKNPEALTMAEELLKSLPPGHWMRPQLAPVICDLLWTTNHKEDAAARAVEFAQTFTDDPDSAIGWRMRAARYFTELRKYPEASEQALKPADAAIAAENPGRAVDAMWTASEAQYFASNFDQVITILKKALALKFENRPEATTTRLRTRITETYTKMNRLADARDAYAGYLTDEPNPELRQRWWISTAKSYVAEKNFPKAIESYEKVFTDQPWLMGRDHWYEAQSEIASLLNQSGDLAGATSAARILFEAADTRDRMTISGTQLLNLIRLADKNPAHTKAIVTFIQSGGEPGERSPLDNIPRVENRARREAFDAADPKMGNDAAAILHRGWMDIYVGRPREATGHFALACQHVGGAQYQAAVQSLLFSGLRSVRGTVAGTEKFSQFLVTGPAAAAASIQDTYGPFTPFLTAPPPITASPSSADTFREIVKRLEAGLEDNAWLPATRLDATLALQRLHDALDDWNRPELLDWYTQRLLAETDSRVQIALLQSALGPAKRGQMHMAGIMQYLNSLNGEALTRECDKARKAWIAWGQKLQESTTTTQMTPRLH